MKTIPLGGGRWRVFLDTDEYRTLLEHAYEPPSRSVRQVRLEMRLMACSLRVGTASGLTYGQFEKRETPEGNFWVVKVEGKDATDREAETRPRAVFVPEDIMEEVHRYADRHNKSEDDQLFQCTKRTVQRDVERSAANAATATGNEEYLKISAHDLRRYFATHLLFRHEVQPAAVRVLGGWMSDIAMFAYLVLPDDVMFARLGEAGLLGTSYDKLSQRDVEEKVEATASQLAELLEAEEIEADTASQTVRETLADIEAVIVDVDAQDQPPSEAADTEHEQSSFRRILDDLNEDDAGAVDPVVATKMAYGACVVVVSWGLTLGGTLG